MILGRSIEEIKDKESFKFDYTDLIKPTIGLGGVTFLNKINDFSSNIINFKDNRLISEFIPEFNDHFYYLTLCLKDNSIKITFDILTGQIIGFECSGDYKGKTKEGIGIGMSIKSAFSVDDKLGFDLDYDVFCHYPFDGLLIYPPMNLRDSCVSAACNNGEFPDFIINSIIILEKKYALTHFEYIDK